jgi:hypothetical protein
MEGLRKNDNVNLGGFCRAAAVQVVAVAALSAVLAFAFSDGFLDNWGWIVGPAAWMACAALTAMTLRLPPGPTLLGALLAGIPSALAVLVGVHWLGVGIALLVFAAWCARLPREEAALSG